MIKNGAMKLRAGNSAPVSFSYLSVQTPGTVPQRNASIHKQVEDDVLVKEIGNAGIITLNRPKALNALNLSMVEKIYHALKKWESSKKLVFIETASEKAFCAGGDVKGIAIALQENNNKLGETFFRKEYTLNYLIGTYKLPYIAAINGVTMGGGVGLSIHGKYRIATEKTLFAMPETAIGLYPDVGGSYFLPRLEGNLGHYLGLTGDRLKGADVLYAGIATHFVPSEKLSDLRQEILVTNASNINNVLNKYQPEKFDHEFSLAPHMTKINKCFSGPSVEEIIRRLKEDKSEWAEKTLGMLLKASPTSLKMTLSAIQKGAKLSLDECLKMEFRLSNAVLNKDSDFYEGVRALLIDKDQKPNWKPKSLDKVTNAYINQIFAKLPEERELSL